MTSYVALSLFVQVSSDSLFDNGRVYIGLVGAFRALEEQMQISEKHPEHGTDSARGMKKFTPWMENTTISQPDYNHLLLSLSLHVYDN